MNKARAGGQFPVPAAEHYIFTVHTAVPSKGTADFFLFDMFLSVSQYEYKRIQYFLYGRWIAKWTLKELEE